MNPSMVGRRSVVMGAVVAGAVALPLARAFAQDRGQPLRPEAFGAKGDGTADDTAAFQALARRVEERGGGTVALRAGATYRIGRQVRGGSTDPVFVPETMFSVSGVNGLVIQGNGATLKLNDGLHYGSFDPGTGQRFDPPPGGFTNPRHGAHVGSLIVIDRSTGVRISDLVLDGNSGKLAVGGKWGDVGIQLHADGLRLLDVADVEVVNLLSRNHGLDGVYLRGRTRAVAANGADAIRFRNLRCTGNGRQGVSVVGGSGISFTACVFADTGQGPINSAPGAGVDIEPNGHDWASALTFQGCEFRNNRGVGLLAADGASRNIVARGCTFWQGFAAGNHGKGSGDAFWLTKPGVLVDACKVHGNVTNLAADALVRGSSFDDAPLSGLGQSAQRRRYLLDNVDGTFEDCSFTVTAPGAHALVYSNKPVTFRRCRMHHAGQSLPSGLAAAFFSKAVTLEDVRFTEALRQPSPAGNYIAANGATLRGHVLVSGPHIRWGASKGPIGDVAAPRR